MLAFLGAILAQLLVTAYRDTEATCLWLLAPVLVEAEARWLLVRAAVNLQDAVAMSPLRLPAAAPVERCGSPQVSLGLAGQVAAFRYRVARLHSAAQDLSRWARELGVLTPHEAVTLLSSLAAVAPSLCWILTLRRAVGVTSAAGHPVAWAATSR